MTALIWWGILALYVAGLFPAAVRLTRWTGTRPARCPRGNSAEWWCHHYHNADCRRRGPVGAREVRDAMPLTFGWPITLVAVLVIREARKPTRTTRTAADLQRQIDDMEKQLGIGGAP